MVFNLLAGFLEDRAMDHNFSRVKTYFFKKKKTNTRVLIYEGFFLKVIVVTLAVFLLLHFLNNLRF